MPLKPNTLNRWRLASLLPLVIALALAGCGQLDNSAVDHTPNILDPQGPIALSESNLFWFILVVSTVVFVIVIAALLYSIIRFRARPGAPEPRQLHGNTTLEIGWTIVPSVVLAGVLVMTITTMVQIQQPTNARTITVNAIGHQWWWEFQYPSEGIVTADEMWVPTGAIVHINLVSNNVIHSFWVPQLTGKTDVIPGHNNAMWLKADATGWYRGECAEFCGTQHAHMDFLVHAVSPTDYQSWVQQQQAPAAQSSDALAQQGQKFFTTGACVGCHMINGVTNNGNSTLIGPNLTHFGSRKWIAGGVTANTPQNLAAWIRDAQSVKNGSDMPSFTTLPQSEIDALVAYLDSLQ